MYLFSKVFTKIVRDGQERGLASKIKIRYDTGDLQLISEKLKSVYEPLGHGVPPSCLCCFYDHIVIAQEDRAFSILY